MDRKKEGKTQESRGFDSSYDKDFLELKKIYSDFKQMYKVSALEILDKLEEKEVFIPISIFNEKLSALETIVKYLKENVNLKNKEIGKITGRSSKVVWQAYDSSRKKYVKKFVINPSKYVIPVSILKSKLSVLESIVAYLKDDVNISYQEIAVLLKRDHRTIWTIYSRVRKKEENE